jgi:hypothetical protein
VTTTKPPGFTTLAVIAELLGVHTTHHDGGPPGYYRHHTRTISTRRGMSVGQYRSTLAHELGHAAYGDHPTGNGHYDRRQEQRADRFALRILITDQEFTDAYRWCGPCVPALADELECTQHHIRLYLALKKEP